MPGGPTIPPAREATPRERLLAALEPGLPMTMLELSREAGLPERSIPTHLEHLGRSLKHRGSRLLLEPPGCIDCGYAFERRRRFTRPGRCPRCRSTHLDSPRVRLV
jgi:predicted Zn-ribbon and HTH transcriptional regulator